MNDIGSFEKAIERLYLSGFSEKTVILMVKDIFRRLKRKTNDTK